MAERRRVRLFTRFERFWHWTQALLVLLLLATGARLHGLIGIGYWGQAFELHLVAAGLIVVLWVFAIFWRAATGEWRQYLPLGDAVGRTVRYYAWGIFAGEAHPHRPSPLYKHNPVQKLAYLALKLTINPALWVTGVLCLTLPWTGIDLRMAALAHGIAAYAMALFLIVHLYMITTGETVGAHLRAMLTGYAQAAEGEAEPGDGRPGDTGPAGARTPREDRPTPAA